MNNVSNISWWDRHLEYFDEIGDPRVKGFFLMSTPIPTIIITFMYALSVTIIGPGLMKNRKPFQLRKVIIGYNFAQVIVSTFLFYEFARFWLTGAYNFRCQPVDYSEDPEAVRVLRAFYFYYLSKFFEFFDTIFFVLRKNNHQISALHVIHHMTVPMSVWPGVKFVGGGHSTFFSLLNSFVHIAMYLYYLLAALGPRLRPYLWWKKYLTVMQMVQFTCFGIHAMQLYFIDCNFPIVIVHVIYGNALLFFGLFYNFFGSNYNKDKKTDGDTKQTKTKETTEGSSILKIGKMCFPGQDQLFSGDKAKNKTN